jgi:hypothetical protein
MPDFDPMDGLTLIDPRYSPDQIEEELPHYRRGNRRDSAIEVFEPSLWHSKAEPEMTCA